MAEYKDKLMKEFYDSPLEIGKVVEVKSTVFGMGYNETTKMPKITAIDGDKITVSLQEYGYREPIVKTINKSEIVRNDRNIGYCPFDENDYSSHIRTLNYPLGNIIHLLFKEEMNEYKDWKINGLQVHETCLNPYVIDKDGNKRYYQRDFCWTLEQKQMLIESIYNHINCGQILVRKRTFEWVKKMHEQGDEWACFFDIVDGKQRLNAIHEFMEDKFPDMHGRYFSDFSHIAQWHFEDSSCLSFAEMDERTTDEQVIQAFLCNNFTGVPQSKEHIEYVKSIYQKLLK